MSEFKESNRSEHFRYAIPVALLFTILCVLGVAAGMEFKDAHHQNGDKPIKDWDWSAWDWKDFKWTMYGGLVGQALQIGVIILVIKLFF